MRTFVSFVEIDDQISMYQLRFLLADGGMSWPGHFREPDMLELNQ
jgi:hypothetical protein